MIEIARERAHSVERDRAEARLEPDQPVARRRDANAAARVGAERDRRDAAGHRHRAARGRSARDPRWIPRVHRRAVMRVDPGGLDAELVHVGLGEDDRAGSAQPRDHLGVRLRRLRLERGAVGRGQAFDVHAVLDDDGDSVERPERRSAGEALARRLRLGGRARHAPEDRLVVLAAPGGGQGTFEGPHRVVASVAKALRERRDTESAHSGSSEIRASRRIFHRIRSRRGVHAVRAATMRKTSPRIGGERAGRCIRKLLAQFLGARVQRRRARSTSRWLSFAESVRP